MFTFTSSGASSFLGLPFVFPFDSEEFSEEMIEGVGSFDSSLIRLTTI